MFADDTTLLASSTWSINSTLWIHTVRCGAKLNRSKSKVLTLNSDQTILEHPRLNFVPSGEPIKYLGIYFGHRLDHTYQLNLISDKFYQSSLTWGCRARTIKGRRLLVKTMILSQLWHFTMVIPVPRETIRQWQSMVNKFIMDRRTRAQDRYIALTNAALIHKPMVGLKVPHIESFILRQRVRRLHQLLTNAHTTDQQWTILPHLQFQDSLTVYCRYSHWDFLWYRPHQQNSLVHWSKLSPLWLDIWQRWTTLPYPKITPGQPPVELYLRMPLWLNSHPLFMVPLSNDTLCLGNALRKSPAVVSSFGSARSPLP
ncbi:hypothetical protein THRCLA_21274 [Thraustotheca clavata]|uniref:Reverse transcriptase domain-containing protein n=1 Tax=Thraustotheca clavata TaxID=74557 RepID=A0A1V9ZY89_9STRA|nr:hypothetical protein THRCLA_21274 [Thraustotheca clavata]